MSSPVAIEQKIELIQCEIVEMDSLIPDPMNSRVHDDINVGAIAGALHIFNQQTPIVIDKDNIIRKGNGVYQAFKKLGWKHINITRTKLEGNDLIAYGLTDNRTSDLSKWNNSNLVKIFGVLMEDDFKLDQVGWTHADLNEKLQFEDDQKIDFTEDFKLDSSKIPDEHNAHKAKSIKVTPAQRTIIDGAVAQVRENMNDPKMKEGRCIELICADFMQSFHNEHEGSFGE